MKVTPAKKKFGKYAPGDAFDLPDQTAKVFIRLGKLVAVGAAPTYQTRMMQAEAPAPIRRSEPVSASAVETDTQGAAWDERVHASTKAKNTDGTWRKRPGAKPAESAEE